MNGELSDSPGDTKKDHPVMALFGVLTTAALVSTLLVMPYILLTAGVSNALTNWWDGLPKSLDSTTLPQRTVLTDANGAQFAQYFSVNRVSIPLSQMGDAAPAALIATEDSRFWEHKGLDAKGVARAIVNNALGGNTQGASTLTQQLVENLRLQSAKTPEELQEVRAHSVRGKLEELRYAVGIEATHTKAEILEAYLNVVYFGNNAYGIEAAAQRYFNKPARLLTFPEASTLIAMLKSPTYYDPIRYPERSLQRRNVVLSRLLSENYISQGQYDRMSQRPLKTPGHAPQQGCGVSQYPFYCQLVTETVLEDRAFGKTATERKALWETGGFEITTNLKPKAMKIAQTAVDRALGRENRTAAGLAMVEPGTGKILAISQNRTWGSPKKGDFSKTEIIYPATPGFQPGSTFKVITAAAAIEEGYSPNTKLNAPSPAYFDKLDEPEGGFKNDTRSGYGYINMREAFKYSVNTYFVGLTNQVGVKTVAAMARRLGMTSVPSDLSGREGSITLGAYETSPIQLANVYATLAARGMACNATSISKMVRLETGEQVRIPASNCRQEIAPAIADTVSSQLTAPFESGGTASKLGIGRTAAGKTGTTNSNAATWFAGYTPQIATAVWVGDPRGGTRYPVSGTYAYGGYHSTVWGGTIAGPIWKETMSGWLAGKEKKWFPAPGGVSAAVSGRILPDVRGLQVDSAVTMLLEAGFAVKINPDNAKPNPNLDKPDYVVKQSPTPGAKAAYGDEVILTLTDGSNLTIITPENFDELLLWSNQSPTGVKQ